VKKCANFVYTSRVLKKITFSAEEADVAGAREKAQAQRTTLNEAFRQWLKAYVGSAASHSEYQHVMRRLSHVSPGKKLSRDELNER
jgi:hypothetical protein